MILNHAHTRWPPMNKHSPWCIDTSKWATYYVVLYPILHFLYVKPKSLPYPWRVPTVSGQLSVCVLCAPLTMSLTKCPNPRWKGWGLRGDGNDWTNFLNCRCKTVILIASQSQLTCCHTQIKYICSFALLISSWCITVLHSLLFHSFHSFSEILWLSWW